MRYCKFFYSVDMDISFCSIILHYIGDFLFYFTCEILHIRVANLQYEAF